MKNLRYFAFIMSTFIFLSCQDKEQASAQQQGPAPMPVVEIPNKTVTAFTSYPASLEGTVNSAVRAKLPGYITEVKVDAGQKVTKGQVLFKLETSALTGEAGASKANVNAAQVEVDKLKPLVEKEIISNVQLETAKARLAQAKASYNSIEANINYATIKSPIDGYVGAISFREGALVSPGDPKPLTTVSQTDKVYAFFAMNEEDYLDFILNAEGKTNSDKIKNFPPVELRLVNGQIYGEEGTIETISGQVDPTTGTVSFRAIFPNPNRLLSNGNSGRIRVPKTYEDVPVVPEMSTYERQGKVYVYKVQGDTLAVPIIVEVTDRVDNLIITKSGVKAGDKIIAEGASKLPGPTPVKPQPVAFDSIANSFPTVFK